jgi:hypothetical protein
MRSGKLCQLSLIFQSFLPGRSIIPDCQRLARIINLNVAKSYQLSIL